MSQEVLDALNAMKERIEKLEARVEELEGPPPGDPLEEQAGNLVKKVRDRERR